MRFGLSTHLFHNERLDHRHLAQAAAAGFGDIEVFLTRSHVDYTDRGRVHEVRRWAEDLGMVIPSVHGPICESFAGGEWGRAFSIASTDTARRTEAVDETRTALEAARVLGAATLVLHLGLPAGQRIPPGDNDPRAMRRSLEDLLPQAAACGVTLALELMPNPLSTAAGLADLLEGDLDLGPTGVCLDIGHAHLEGPVDVAVDRLGGSVTATHVHDNSGREDAHLVPFQGSIDWPMTLACLWKVGYRGLLVFEVADRGDAPGVLSRLVGARTRLQAILDDLGGFTFEPV